MESVKKKESFRSFLRSFTPYQTIYLAAVVLLTASLLIFFPEVSLGEYGERTALIVCAVVSTISNPLCELLISKQSKWNFVVDFFLIEIPELVICLNFGWYAVAATVLFFWMPIDIISFLRWTRHPDEEDGNLTQVKRLKPRQSALAILGILAFGFIVGTLLTYIPGASDSYLDAFASAVGIANGVLLLLRYSEQWFAWLITTILYLFMDISSGLYILLVTEIAMLVNTIYGMVKWFLYTRRHEARGQNDSSCGAPPVSPPAS